MSILELGAASSMVQGVKGDAESTYRTGNVNITPANIGASPSDHTHSYLPLSGGTLTGALTVNSSITATGQPGFNSSVSAGNWSYLRLNNGSNLWDIATNSSQNSGCLDFRPAGQANKGPRISTSGMASFANSGSDTSSSRYTQAAVQIRETNYGGSGSDTWGVAPRLAFHWSGRCAAEIGLASNGNLYVGPNAHYSTSMYQIVFANGGSWNITASNNVPKRSVLSTTETNGNLTLNASAANYNHMRIYYRSNDQFHHSMTVVSPNRTVKISGNSIASGTPNSGHASYNEVYLSQGGVGGGYNNNIYIYRVEAWNE